MVTAQHKVCSGCINVEIEINIHFNFSNQIPQSVRTIALSSLCQSYLLPGPTIIIFLFPLTYHINLTYHIKKRIFTVYYLMNKGSNFVVHEKDTSTNHVIKLQGIKRSKCCGLVF